MLADFGHDVGRIIASDTAKVVDDRPDPARPRRRRYHELATTHRAGFVLARVVEWLETSGGTTQRPRPLEQGPGVALRSWPVPQPHSRPAAAGSNHAAGPLMPITLVMPLVARWSTVRNLVRIDWATGSFAYSHGDCGGLSLPPEDWIWHRLGD